MDVETRHPDLTVERRDEWRLMRDAGDGESAIKSSTGVALDTHAGSRDRSYLPMPGGFRTQSDQGAAMYGAYKGRAQFPEILAPSISAMVGIVHGKDITIEMPPGLDFIWERATATGLDLESFHRRITRQLLTFGRYGVLTDAPEAGGNPFLAGYAAETIINWDGDAFYVLDESGYERDGYKWARKSRYRVLELVEGRYSQRIIAGRDTASTESTALPVARGAQPLQRIPFVVASARDVSNTIDTPPLIGVARAALAIYQLSADYRHQLFMSGQETLVAINGDAPTAVGAGVVHRMIGAEGQSPDLKYVSPSCSGIEAHKAAMEDNRVAAIMAGARLFDGDGGGNESGSARKLRFASETATLSSVAMASCSLLERALRNAALMLGLNENDVTVTPPRDLLDSTMTPADAQALVSVWQAGAISYQTLHDNLARGGIANAERDAEAEIKLIDDEQMTEDENITPPAMQAP